MRQARIDNLYKDCPAALTRMTQEIHELLLGIGDPSSDLMFIVDAPSREEENYAISFYGKSGAKIDSLLQDLDLDRDSAYLTYAVKYHPYKISLSTGRFSKRAIKQDEIDFFLPYLKDEIDIVRPKILITLGEMPLRALTGEADLKLGSQHGKVRSVKILERTYKLLPMINPITMKASENQHLMADIEVLKRLMGTDGETAGEAEEDEAIERSARHRQDIEANTADAGFDHDEAYTVGDSGSRLDFGVSDSDSSGDFVADLLENNLRMKEKNSQARQASDMDEMLSGVPGRSDAGGHPAKVAMRTRDSGPTMTPVAIKEDAFPSKTGKMKAIIVYGGDGFADDPTLVVLDRVSQVLAELNTRIVRIDLYKKDYDLKSFLDELSEAKAVILATTVEWLGIGGRMQTFLDDCWRFANKQDFVGCYLFGVVISRQSNERDAYNHLIKSWELLGGLEGSSLCSRIAKSVDLETSSLLLGAIDKKTEEFYRIAQQGRTVMPTSIRSNRVYMEVPNTGTSVAETPSSGQDSIERTGRKLPEYDVYVERQQKDIEDLAQLFKQKMGTHSEGLQKSEPERFIESYIGSDDNLAFKLQWNLDDRKARAFHMEIKGRKIHAKAGQIGDATITVQSDFATLDKILDGRLTVQRAFMTGEIKAKGDFTVLYKMDGLFKL